MKTSKFDYRVYVSDDEFIFRDYTSAGYVDCVTLAEARCVARRHSYSVIVCQGKVFYKNGLELD